MKQSENRKSTKTKIVIQCHEACGNKKKSKYNWGLTQKSKNKNII